MDAVGPSPDLRIALEPRAIARRLAIPAAFAAIVAAVLVVAGGPLQTFADALRRALDADPRWVVAAVGFELAPSPATSCCCGSSRAASPRG